jgi:hypothetical protein
VVDASYSGGLIDELRNDYSVIASAAADRTSFGCGNEAEMTYLERAFLRHGLAWKYSFIDSFDDAASLIKRWETTQNLSTSNSQIFAGSALVPKLNALERRLQAEANTVGRR